MFCRYFHCLPGVISSGCQRKYRRFRPGPLIHLLYRCILCSGNRLFQQFFCVLQTFQTDIQLRQILIKRSIRRKTLCHVQIDRLRLFVLFRPLISTGKACGSLFIPGINSHCFLKRHCRLFIIQFFQIPFSQINVFCKTRRTGAGKTQISNEPGRRQNTGETQEERFARRFRYV